MLNVVRRSLGAKRTGLPTIKVDHIKRYHSCTQVAFDGQKSILCGVALDHVARLVVWTLNTGKWGLRKEDLREWSRAGFVKIFATVPGGLNMGWNDSGHACRTLVAFLQLSQWEVETFCIE